MLHNSNPITRILNERLADTAICKVMRLNKNIVAKRILRNQSDQSYQFDSPYYVPTHLYQPTLGEEIMDEFNRREWVKQNPILKDKIFINA